MVIVRFAVWSGLKNKNLHQTVNRNFLFLKIKPDHLDRRPNQILKLQFGPI